MPYPVIRIAGLVALAVGLAAAAAPALLVASLLLALMAWLAGSGVSLATATLRRLRWLFVTIILLYGWFLPGSALIPQLGAFSPSVAGLLEGLRRSWMLWVMATAARLLIATTPRESLVAALAWWLSPLRLLRLDPSRFCLRLVLTLEYALELGPAFRRGGEGNGNRGGLVKRAEALARSGLARAEARADRAGESTVTVPRSAAPPVYQWAYPAGLLVGLLALSGV